MTRQKSRGGQTVLWWIVWIVLTIAAFFVSAAMWTPFIAQHFGPVRESRNSVLWITAVFGTWLVILVPLIIVMYQKVDKAYEDARMRREKAALRFRSIHVDPERRKLPKNISEKLRGKPETLEGGHLVNLILKSGRQIPSVFVAHTNDILGIYNAEQMDFEGQDVRDVELIDMSSPPVYHVTQWLRLDGISVND